MRQRWKESALLSGILVLSAGLAYGSLSHWKRTPHLYEYDRNQIKEQEKNPELVQQGDSQEENRREHQKPKNKNNRQNPDTEQREMDDENNNEQDATDSDNKRSDSDGDDAMNGDGGSGDSNVPNQNLPSGNPNGTPAPVDEGGATASPRPTQKPTQSSEPEKDKVVKITCTWADRKELLYGEKIPKDTIKVTAEYSSGEKKEITSDEYTIRQLKNDSVGKHTMTVSYNRDDSISCKLDYVVNNFTKSLTYSWPTKDQCYKGEEFPSEALTVKTKMADGTTKKTTQYEITGFNNILLDVDQKFKITYKDTMIKKTFTAEGTCRFLNRKITLHCYYYKDEDMKNLIDKRTYNGDYDYYADEIISLRAFTSGDLEDKDSFYKKKQYTLKEISLAEVDSAGNSRDKSLPYKVKERFFDAISLTKRYVLAEQ